mgnify:CR=1 FL=1
MNVVSKLASSMNRRDEVPNQELAKEIVKKEDEEAIQELIDLLSDKNKKIQNDCIKVLYEVGEIKPALISSHLNVFLDLLDHKNNRLQWGAMTALNTIASEDPDSIYESISTILKAADKGSIITRDQAVHILIKLCSSDQHSDSAFLLLNEQMLSSPTNQLPMYAENALVVITIEQREMFTKTLKSRLDDIEKESKRKRVEKVLKKLDKME